MTKSSRKKSAGDRKNDQPQEDAEAERLRLKKAKIAERDYLPRVLTGPQCSGHRKNGERCKNRPMKGTTVCRRHGGAAPQVRKKAKERLMAEADGLMAALIKIAYDENTPVYVRLQAIRDALDRAGFGAKHAVSVKLDEDDPWANLLNGVTAEIDRDMSELQTEQEAIEQARRDRVENAVALGEAVREEAWHRVEDEDLAADERSRFRFEDGRTVQGEVVGDGGPFTPPVQDRVQGPSENDPSPARGRYDGQRRPWEDFERRLLEDLDDGPPRPRYRPRGG